MSALTALINQAAQKDLWETYVADLAWFSVRLLYGKSDFPLSPYSAMCKKAQRPADTRTGEEIRAAIIEQLRKEVETNETV